MIIALLIAYRDQTSSGGLFTQRVMPQMATVADDGVFARARQISSEAWGQVRIRYFSDPLGIISEGDRRPLFGRKACGKLSFDWFQSYAMRCILSLGRVRAFLVGGPSTIMGSELVFGTAGTQDVVLLAGGHENFQ